jgi:hypothetical protein
MTSPDALLQTIHDLRGRSIAGDDEAAADLYGFRMQLLRRRERLVREHGGAGRICERCAYPRPDADYSERGRICRLCRAAAKKAYDAAYGAAYHAAHQDDARAKMRANYEKRKPEYHERSIRWAAEHPTKHAEYKRTSRQRKAH